ncbi:hypothetical protein ASE63_22290 [Bosea sp. Root381]|nr:hypothetical protein ASE63_22290 [Bosea sp. Root381]
METELKRHLLTLVEAYAGALGIGVTTVWRQAINDPAFQERLRSENTITLRTYDRAVAWFAENWPETSAWPAEVPRRIERAA